MNLSQDDLDSVRNKACSKVLKMQHLIMTRLSKMLNLILVVSLVSSCSSGDSSAAISILQGNGKGGGLGYQEVSARVFIAGQLAETTLEITFSNSEDRDVEAHLDLPLPEGASISSYALEVDGRMREGTIVEKQLGRVAFEDTTRKNIDPGLLEKTGGNRFRTRIYPVPAKGTKRVRLSYLQQLKGNGSLSNYQLPLPKGNLIAKFTFDISANESKTIITPKQKGGLSFMAENYRAKNLSYQISSSGKGSQALVQSGKDGRRYFYLTDPAPNLAAVKRPHPNNILLVWDASNSGALRDHKKEIALLDSYIGALSNTNVDLHLLREKLASAGSFQVQNGNWSSLRTTLKNLTYDGATRLDHADLRGVGYDQVLFISDGLSTFGSGKVHFGDTPVFTLNSSPQANHHLLDHVARETGGVSLDLSSGNIDSALRELTHQQITLLKVTGAGIHDLIVDTKGGMASARGRLSQESTMATLHYGTNGVTRFKRSVRLSSDNMPHGNIAPKLWAQGKVDQLGINPKRNKEAIIAFAKIHHLVTDHTSLIVLDRLEDYLTYGITPTESKMRKEYFARRRDRELLDGSRPTGLDDIYQDWKDLVAWHRGSWKNRPEESAKSVIFPAPVIELPSMGGEDVSGIATAGLRSGAAAVNRNSIDAILNNPGRSSSSVKVNDWQSGAPYLRAYQKAIEASRPLLPVYFQWKKKNQLSPGFYLESADVFASQNQHVIARRILSNLAELSPESPEFLRILAHRYCQLGEHVLAEMLFREVAELRAEEPQSYRDLALSLIKLSRYREAEQLLWKVVSRKWARRFDGIEMIALNEWNHLHEKYGEKLPLRSSQKRFRHSLDSDIRILISWDTDNSDMDLWVTDPAGEKCYYSNRLTKVGGRISNDFTDGRGPEEFMIRRAPQGIYKVQADYYGTREQTSIGPTTLHATIITNWGRKSETRKHLTFQLGATKEVVEIGEVEFGDRQE